MSKCEGWKSTQICEVPSRREQTEAYVVFDGETDTNGRYLHHEKRSFKKISNNVKLLNILLL